MAKANNAPNAPVQNTIFRMDATATRTVPVGEKLHPSYIDDDRSGNIGAIAGSQSFFDFAGGGFFVGYSVGVVFVTTGFTQTENNGVWRVVDVKGADEIVVVDALGAGAVVVDESGAGTMAFSATGERKKYRAYMFNIEVGVTFNGDAGTTIVLPALTPLFLTESMVEIETDAEAVMYWGE